MIIIGKYNERRVVSLLTIINFINQPAKFHKKCEDKDDDYIRIYQECLDDIREELIRAYAD